MPLDAVLVRFSTYSHDPSGIDGRLALERLADSLGSSGTTGSSMVIRGDAQLRFTLGVVLRKVDRSRLVTWLSSARSWIASNVPGAPITIGVNGFVADCTPFRARALSAAAADAYWRARQAAAVGDLRLGRPLAILGDVTIQSASCDELPSDPTVALDAVGSSVRGFADSATRVATALASVKVTYAAF